MSTYHEAVQAEADSFQGNDIDPAAMKTYLSLRGANIARQEEWDPAGDAKNLDWRMNELAGEVGEVCNVLKKLHRERCGIPGSRATKDQLADELADVLICLDLTLMTQGSPESFRLLTNGVSLTRLTSSGHRLFAAVARFFNALGSEGTVDISDRANRVHTMVDLIAKAEGINLDMAVEKKFNETTRKVGLTTFLNLTLTDN